MIISVNGEKTTLDQSCTVRDLLSRTNLENAVCAVEVNRKLVPKKHHEAQVLNDGDAVEIVTLVGGG
jgi:sulfur carrier protein